MISDKIDLMKSKFNFTNKEISELLENIAAAYIVKNEDRFRIMAYEKAAGTINASAVDIKELWEQGKLDSLPGIGKKLAQYIDELFRSGKVKHFEQVLKDLPKALFEFMKIPGIGPKNAYKLCLKLKINDKKDSIERLKKAAELGKIRTIEGFGEKSEQEILQGIEELGRRGKRLLLPYALNIAQKVLSYLKKSSLIKKAEILGSLRRKAGTIGDIDIAIVSNKPEEAIKWFINYPHKIRLLEAGLTKASILIFDEQQIDLRVVENEAYGSLLQHFTGSKNHNIHLREIALKKGLSLSEYGIRKIKDIRYKIKDTIQFAEEKKFYNYLGMEWIMPELREDRGEIELALQNKLPKLVELKDIKGDLHLHSNFNIESSHDVGENSMEEMINKARLLNYNYIAFSEHNPSISQHSEKEIIDIIKRKKNVIDKLNYSIKNKTKKGTQKLFIFNSLEIDIRPDGRLAVPNKALAELDFGIASIHSSFKMSAEEITKRVLTAMAYPKIKILAHPTGRLLNKREGYELNWDKIFDFCKKNNKFLEINAYPQRLDLPDELVLEAIKNGVKLVINTDSHHLKEMELMKYGVFNGRRGWAKQDDIINTLSYNEIRKLLI